MINVCKKRISDSISIISNYYDKSMNIFGSFANISILFIEFDNMININSFIDNISFILFMYFDELTNINIIDL